MDWRLYAHYLVCHSLPYIYPAGVGTTAGMVWVVGQLYFLISTPLSSLPLFIPSIVNGLGYTSLNAQLMTIPPFAAAYVVSLLVAWSSDRYNARAMHAASLALIGAAGFMASATLPVNAYMGHYVTLVASAVCTFAATPPPLSFLASNTNNTASTGLAVALNVSLGGRRAYYWACGFTRLVRLKADIRVGTGLMLL